MFQTHFYTRMTIENLESAPIMSYEVEQHFLNFSSSAQRTFDLWNGIGVSLPCYDGWFLKRAGYSLRPQHCQIFPSSNFCFIAQGISDLHVDHTARRWLSKSDEKGVWEYGHLSIGIGRRENGVKAQRKPKEQRSDSTAPSSAVLGRDG
jgi:hypothetical protein